jgi:phosphatidate cytidylyltransferase
VPAASDRDTRPVVPAASDRDMRLAVPVAVALVTLVVVGLIWVPPVFVGVVVLGVVVGMAELHRAFRDHAGIKTAIFPATVGAALTVAAAGVLVVFEDLGPDISGQVFCADEFFGLLCRSELVSGQRGAAFGVVVLGLTLTAAFCLVWLMRRGVEGYARAAAATVFILVYPGLFCATFVLMLGGPHGSAGVALFVIAVVGCDTGGHAVGVRHGKHKMAPKLSPKKSWEGVAGSLVLAPLAGLVVAAIALDTVWWRVVVVCEIAAVVGILGDLVESAVKRDLGIKDLGSVIPGHGGVMDRVDSYLVAAPFAWVATTLLL